MVGQLAAGIKNQPAIAGLAGQDGGIGHLNGGGSEGDVAVGLQDVGQAKRSGAQVVGYGVEGDRAVVGGHHAPAIGEDLGLQFDGSGTDVTKIGDAHDGGVLLGGIDRGRAGHVADINIVVRRDGTAAADEKILHTRQIGGHQRAGGAREMKVGIESEIGGLNHGTANHPESVIKHDIAAAQGDVLGGGLEAGAQVLVHDEHMIDEIIGDPVGGARAGVGLDVGPIGGVGGNIATQPVECGRKKIADDERILGIAQIHIEVAKIHRRRIAQEIGRIDVDKPIGAQPEVGHLVGLAGVELDAGRLAGDVGHAALGGAQDGGGVIEQTVGLFRIAANLGAIKGVGHGGGNVLEFAGCIEHG